jgi:hypothetical protein
MGACRRKSATPARPSSRLLALRVVHQLVPHCIEDGEGSRERQTK